MKSYIAAAILAWSAALVASAPLPFPQSGEIYRAAVCPPWCGAGSDLDNDAWRKFRELTGQNNIKPPTVKRGEGAEPDIWSKLRTERHGNFYQVHRRDALSVAANPDGTIPKKSQEAIDRWNAQFGTPKEQQHNGEKLAIPTNPDGSVSKEWQEAVDRWQLKLDDTPPPHDQQRSEALPLIRNANGDAGLTATSWEIYNRLPDPSNGTPHIGKLFGGQEKREALPAAAHPLQLSHETIDRLNRKLGVPPQQKREALSVAANPDGSLSKESQEALDRWNEQFNSPQHQHGQEKREALPVAAANWGASVSQWTQEAANRLNAKLDAQQ